jgi:hypothetical protein
MLNELHKKYIDHMILVNNMQVKMFVEDLVPNEDVVEVMNSYNNEDMLPKQMHIAH